MVDQAELIGAFRRQVFARKQHLRCDRIGNLSTQAHGGTSHRKQTALNFCHAEHGTLPGDPDIGSLENLGSARAGKSLGRKNHRLGRSIGLQPTSHHDVGLAHHAFHPFIAGLARAELRDLRKVHPRTEGVALACQDRDAEFGVFVESNPGVVESTHHFRVDAILLFRPIQGDGEDVTLLFDDDGRHGMDTPRVVGWRRETRPCDRADGESTRAKRNSTASDRDSLAPWPLANAANEHTRVSRPGFVRFPRGKAHDPDRIRPFRRGTAIQHGAA